MHIPKALLLAVATAWALHAPSTFAKDSDDAAKLREAMREKLAETKGAQSAPAKAAPAAPAKPAPKPAPAKPAPAPAPVKPAAKPAPAAPATPPAAPAAKAAPAASTAAVELGDSADDAALREAMRSRMEEQPTVTAAPTAKAPAAPAEKAPQSAKATPAKSGAFQPLEAPASPLTGTKEERLKQLLDQYKADQITPEEYHTQRAKIVAE